ncbi:hypothetical protein chiPu_0018053 [Chiloscyllium punctatum]|uniref:Uncharacterized protein n=1 Tax=Chiloscyllium punctatum TaxID=137246 RepID=A0A401RKY8_CHIPU|nr:hypothetical protein [Chiloscyllium punctatum]
MQLPDYARQDPTSGSVRATSCLLPASMAFGKTGSAAGKPEGDPGSGGAFDSSDGQRGTGGARCLKEYRGVGNRLGGRRPFGPTTQSRCMCARGLGMFP